jgi:hypothetical protein
MSNSLRRVIAAPTAIALTGLVLGGCGGSTTQNPVPLVLLNTQSSWIPGEPSLLSFDAYRSIADRADTLAGIRQNRRDLELSRIEAELKAAERRLKAEALRKYEEAKRKAQEAYHKALREAARQKRIAARRLAAAKAKRARELAALRRKLQVKPGEECKLPEVAVYFTCRKGMTPLPKPLPRG